VDFEKWIPVMDDPSKYFATPAVNLVWAMKKSLELIEEEGLKARSERHKKNAQALHAAFEALGFSILAQPGVRACTLTTLIYPEGVEDAKFRKTMIEEGAIVAAALASYAGKACRAGHMGNITVNDMVYMLGAIERSLAKCGIAVEFGKGVGTYLSKMANAK
jgi:aspartate aminotransferase-like enzyme